MGNWEASCAAQLSMESVRVDMIPRGLDCGPESQALNRKSVKKAGSIRI